MSIALHAQLIMVGISIGCVYALVALGFLLIFNGVGAINFAQGDLVMVGGYLAVTTAVLSGLPPLIALVIVIGLMAVIGFGFGRVLYIPIRDKPYTIFIIVTVGASIMMSNAAQIVWGPYPLTMPSLTGGHTFRVFGAVLPTDYIAVGTVCVAALASLYVFFMYTFTGRKLRAVAGDRQTAELVGIDVGRMTSVAFILSGIVSGVAGFLIAPLFFVTPTMGPPLSILAFVVIVIGGFGNMVGAVLAAFAVGILQSYVGYYISTAYKDSIIFAIAILALLVLPRGLLGESVEEKV
jgi:branched-chain amino acid transport system permease protein